MKVAIVNYGMGNLASVRRALDDLAVESFIAELPSALYEAEKIILPGVGSFSEGMERLNRDGWADTIRTLAAKGKTLLGICLGMQMLASTGTEGGNIAGLGLIAGEVVHLEKIGCKLRIPHVGWNDVKYHRTDDIFGNIPENSDFYFVHSYAFVPENPSHLVATVSYHTEITAVVRSQNVIGCQFHPEKSSKVGRQLLRNFLETPAC